MERKIRRAWQRKTAAVAAAMLTVSLSGISHAMPQGDIVRSGAASIQKSEDNKTMEVNQSTKRVAIDWSNFDIANDEKVNFKQPDAASIALNRVTGDAKSVIDGQLASNGHIFVVNPNGVLFGKNASVDVGGLVASTAKVSDETMQNFGTGTGETSLSLDTANTSSVINEGTIRAQGGLVALQASVVENNGTIENNGGKIALSAARTINLAADTAGKLNFAVDGTLAKASTLNRGVLKADGGYVVMTAKQAGDVMSTVVNNTGTIEAKTLREDDKGEILLDGGNAGVVSVAGTLDVSGTENGQSAGSLKVTGQKTYVHDDAALLANGAVNGGTIETSGNYLNVSDAAKIDTSAAAGRTGTWLLDPTEVIIASKDSDTYKNAQEVNSDVSANSGTTVISTESLANRLQTNNVTIEAADAANHMADITLADTLNVNSTTIGSNTLTLQAENDVILNAAIQAGAPLNVVLIGDSNGDNKGGVHINADVATGGGDFTIGGNSATFFGTSASGNDRTINTNGGDVNIQNEVRLQLDGGTLRVNTNGGNVTFAKNIASMNGYTAYMDFDFVSYYKGELTTRTAQAIAWENMLKKVYGQTYTDADGNAVVFAIKDGSGQVIAYDSLTPEQKIAASNQLAEIWELASRAASFDNSSDDPLGQKINGSHLVTITDAYENTAAMAGAEKRTGNTVEYFTGGKDVTDPATSSTAGRTFAWMTGPEAGNVFYITTGEGEGYEVNGSYTNWVRNEPINPKKSDTKYYNEPNNGGEKLRQPYVAVGWTDKNGWDDVQNGYQTVHGFIQETELPNSALAINSGSGSVTVGTAGNADTGRIGSSEGTAVRNLDITTTGGDVTLYGSVYVHDNNTYDTPVADTGKVNITSAGNITTQAITADSDVTITGKGADKIVNINGKINSEGAVNVTAANDLLVHGIEATGQIKLISTGADGSITLGTNDEDGGAIRTSSAAADAVIIDAQGERGKFINDTTSTQAITTGAGGSWKVYSSSPELDTFGTNLNSGTNAQWHANSSTYAEDTITNSTGKYIFQVQPTIMVKVDDKSKTYGDTFDPANYSASAADAVFEGRDGATYSVTDPRFQNAFNEGNLSSHYSGTLQYESDGATASATRTGGLMAADDGNKAIYVIYANGTLTGKDGYAVSEPEIGTLEILRRDANIAGKGTQTYGQADVDWTTASSNLVNGDQLDTSKLAIRAGSTYEENQAGRTTADAGNYEDAITFGGILNQAGEDASANYNLTGNGSLTVNKAALHLKTDDITTIYGTVNENTATTVDGLVNGDLPAGFIFDYGDYGGAYLDNNTRTNEAGRYTFKTSYNDPGFLRNYVVTADDATVTILPERTVVPDEPSAPDEPLTPEQPDPPAKPDIDHNNPSSVNGSASYAANLGSHGVPGVDRVAGLASAELPFFKLSHGMLTNYGTYNVTADPDKVTLEPTGKRLPEPDQPKTQYREYTTDLTTAAGTGSFRLVYDGSTFRIHPQNAEAQSILQAGDARHNVELAAQALKAGFNSMGLMLEDLDAVYVQFGLA